MSVKVMSMVFEYYPEGGGEMLLALALADFADDDGSRIYPSVAALAKKTRQSERSIQYQIQKMMKNGFLSLVEAGGRVGKKYRANEYKINLPYFVRNTVNNNSATTATAPTHQDTSRQLENRGAKIAPLPEVTENNSENKDEIRGAKTAPLKTATVNRGAIQDNQGCNLEHSGVQSETFRGATAIAPQPPKNHHNAITTTITSDQGGSPCSSQPNPKTVVVNDLIFPPLIRPDQRQAILTLLSNSGVSTDLWQTLIDELHGAQLAKTIENPVGYVRGIAKHAAEGTFVPERAMKIAEKRNRQHPPAIAITSPRERITPDQSQIDRLPVPIRSALARIIENSSAKVAK